MSDEIVSGTEFEQLSSGTGDNDVLWANKPLLQEESFGVVKEESTATVSVVSAHQSGEVASRAEFELLSNGKCVSNVIEDNKPLLQKESPNVVKEESLVSEVSSTNVEVSTPHPEFEQLSSGSGDSEVLGANESLLQGEGFYAMKEENYVTELPSTDAGVFTQPCDELTEFETVESLYGDNDGRELLEANKSLLQEKSSNIVKDENYAAELPAADTVASAPQPDKPAEFEELPSVNHGIDVLVTNKPLLQEESRKNPSIETDDGYSTLQSNKPTEFDRCSRRNVIEDNKPPLQKGNSYTVSEEMSMEEMRVANTGMTTQRPLSVSPSDIMPRLTSRAETYTLCTNVNPEKFFGMLWVNYCVAQHL